GAAGSAEEGGEWELSVRAGSRLTSRRGSHPPWPESARGHRGGGIRRRHDVEEAEREVRGGADRDGEDHGADTDWTAHGPAPEQGRQLDRRADPVDGPTP